MPTPAYTYAKRVLVSARITAPLAEQVDEVGRRAGKARAAIIEDLIQAGLPIVRRRMAANEKRKAKEAKP
jgi:hypothetical protein